MIKAVLFILVSASVCFSQQISVSLKNQKDQTAKLYQLSGEKLDFVDSLHFTNNGVINYKFPETSLPGIYRIFIDSSKWIDFVYDHEDIQLSTDASNILDSMLVISSVTNRLYYDFIKLNQAFKVKSELLQLILARYPKDDPYFKETQRTLQELQNEYIEFVNLTAQVNPNSFIARYILSAQLPIVDQGIPTDKQLDYLKTHEIDNVNFSDISLINSDLFSNKSIEFLSYFRNPQLPKELLEKDFMKAVDTLLTKASINLLVYQHIADYLIIGFKKFGFDNVVDYIIENYIVKDDLCLNEQTENSIQNRINQSKLLAIGSIAPNIILLDVDGNVYNLSESKNERILLVFYSSQCPHCQDMLPELNRLQKSNSVIDIAAISLDTDKKVWEDFVQQNILGLINISDLKGWDSKAARDFYIYATPTMFVLDKEKQIIGKPLLLEEVRKYFD